MTEEQIVTTSPFDSLLERLTNWRASNRRGAPLPAEMWSEAAGLASEYGVSRVSRGLQLSYQTLAKKLAAEEGADATAAPVGDFLEMFPPAASLIEEVTLELQSQRGNRLKLEMRKVSPEALSSLVRELAL